MAYYVPWNGKKSGVAGPVPKKTDYPDSLDKSLRLPATAVLA